MALSNSPPKPANNTSTATPANSRLHRVVDLTLAGTFPHLMLLSIIPALYVGGLVYLLPLAMVFILVPGLDFIFGENTRNNSADHIGPVATTLLTWSPVVFVTFFFGLLFVQISLLDTLTNANVALSLSAFLTAGTLVFSGGHELIHKKAKFQRIPGELVFIFFGYWHFAVAHVHNHHAHVATLEDKYAPSVNTSFWHYLGASYPKGVRFTYGWLKKNGLKHRVAGREVNTSFVMIIAATAFPLVLSVALAGPMGLFYYVFVCVFSLLFSEAVFYIEHYGLRRAPGSPVTTAHSWDSFHRFSNYLMFMVQRHADHHKEWSRDYYLLEHHTGSARLPCGYPLLVPLVLMPPLFFWVMNKRAEEHAEATGMPSPPTLSTRSQ